MRKTLITLFAIFCCITMVHAQTQANFAGATTSVSYDFKTKILTGQIPFDRPFQINITNINSDKIKKISIFEVTYNKNGLRKLVVGSPSFNLVDEDTTLQGKNNLILRIPAIRGNRDFDILLLKELSDETLNQITVIDAAIFLACEKDADYLNDKKLQTKIEQLNKRINNWSPMREGRNFTTIDSLKQYDEILYKKIDPEYRRLADTGESSKIKRVIYFKAKEILSIFNSLDDSIVMRRQFFLLKKISDDKAQDLISFGFKSINYTYPIIVSRADQIDFSARITNLDKSIKYFSSLNDYLLSLSIRDSSRFFTIQKKTKSIIDDLIYNKQFISDTLKSINNKIAEVYKGEGIWLIGSNSVDDFKAKGLSIFTVDIGVTNIIAYDNLNKRNYMPKLFLGLNVYLKPHDKNISRKSQSYNNAPEYSLKDTLINGKKTKVRDKLLQTHALESHRSWLDDFAITGGFTLGSMQNKKFDNVTNGISFTLGPSISLFKYARLSSGISFLTRKSANPVESYNKFIVGGYVSLSLDYDLLDAVKKVTQLLF